MKVEMFSVYDAVTATFNKPFCAVNPNDACRMIHAACTPDTHIYKNADDYRIYYVGEFDQSTGELQYTVPVMVMTVAEIRAAVIKDGIKVQAQENEE